MNSTQSKGEGDASILIPKNRLLFIATTNNKTLKTLLRGWVIDHPNARDLSDYHPHRVNTSAILVDDTEYTRRLGHWIKTRYREQIVILEWKPVDYGIWHYEPISNETPE